MPVSQNASELHNKNMDLLVFGEVLFDVFEADVRVLGGAPFNVAWGLKGLGHDPHLLSAVGNDADGEQILEQMTRWGMDASGVARVADVNTGTVKVIRDGDDQRYEICENVAWDFLSPDSVAGSQLLYHGSLALRSAANKEVLDAAMEVADQRFFDVNLREPYYNRALIERYMQSADWVKLNLDELCYMMDTDKIPFEAAQGSVTAFREKYAIANLVLTAGAEGALIDGDYGSAIISPAPKPDPFVDTVGAGDAFVAVLLGGILRSEPAVELISKAGHFASRACGLQGATTDDKSFYKV
ncbi:MAG: PfkB family carbohydrate kinase [Opitutales bacterium]